MDKGGFTDENTLVLKLIEKIPMEVFNYKEENIHSPSNAGTSAGLRSSRSIANEPQHSPPPQSNDSTPVRQYVPVPTTFILHACLIVAALLRAFPSAHQATHISLFLIMAPPEGLDTREWKNACGMRILGGYIATAAVILYYWVVYIWAGHAEGKGLAAFVRKGFIELRPGFLDSKLVIPDSLLSPSSRDRYK